MSVRIGKQSINIRIIPTLIMVYAALIPLENVLSSSLGGSVNKYIGILIMAMVALWMGSNHKFGRFYIEKTIIVFLCFAAISMVWSIDHNTSILSVMVNAALFTIIVVQYPLTLDERTMILASLFIGGIIVGVMMLSGGRFSALNTIDRDRMSVVINGLIIDNNNLAVSLGLSFISGSALIYKRKAGLVFKVAVSIGLLILLIGIIRTGSRGGLLAIILGGVCFLLYADSGIRPRNLIIGAIVAYFAMYYIQTKISTNLASRFTLSEVISSGGTGRLQIWSTGLRLYKDSGVFRWLFGYGFGSFANALSGYAGIYKAAHNDLIQMLVDLGIIGVVLYLTMWITLFKKALYSKSPALIGLLAVVAFGSLSMELLIKKMLWFVFLLVILHTKENSEE